MTPNDIALAAFMAPAKHAALPCSAKLTRRELQVLSLLLAGETDKEIARGLGISPRTASHHVASILHKLNVETRKGAQRWAAGNGYTPTEPPIPSLPAAAAAATTGTTSSP